MGKLKPINPTKAQIVANPQAAAHDYDNLTHKPQINGHELVGDKSSDDLGLQGKLTAGENITIENNVISATASSDYNDLTNKPQINGHELVGNKSSDDLGLQGKLTAGENITIDANGEISASGGVTSYQQLSDLPTLYYTTRDSYHQSGQPFRTFLNFSTGLYCSLGDGGVSVNVRTEKFFWCDEYGGWNIDSLGSLQGRSFSSVDIPSGLSNCPEIVTNSITSNEKVIFWQIGNGKIEKTAQFIAWKDTDGNSRLIYRQADNLDSTLSGAWIEVNPSIVSASVNQNGTITFTMSDGSTVTTTGESVIGTQGDDYVLTAQDKTDIANIVLSELPTTQGVQYGNTSN